MYTPLGFGRVGQVQYLRTKTKRIRVDFFIFDHTQAINLKVGGIAGRETLQTPADTQCFRLIRLAGGRVCLIGNVNCGLLDTGTDEDVRASAAYALKSGMPGGGYVFSTSNCIYTGMKLARYETMLEVWRKNGNYPE